MRKGQVLSDDEVRAEIKRLCDDLRRARKSSGRAQRDVAAEAQIPQATVWRIETGKNEPTLLRFILLTNASDHLVDLDDGTARPLVPTHRWPPYPGYRTKRRDPAPGESGWRRHDQQEDARPFRGRIGSELWYARHHDMPEPLSAEEVCRQVEMNHHTLKDIEFGPDWPYLTSVVRVAGFLGRRLVLNRREDGWRLPPWVSVAPPPAAAVEQ